MADGGLRCHGTRETRNEMEAEGPKMGGQNHVVLREEVKRGGRVTGRLISTPEATDRHGRVQHPM